MTLWDDGATTWDSSVLWDGSGAVVGTGCAWDDGTATWDDLTCDWDSLGAPVSGGSTYPTPCTFIGGTRPLRCTRPVGGTRPLRCTSPVGGTRVLTRSRA